MTRRERLGARTDGGHEHLDDLARRGAAGDQRAIDELVAATYHDVWRFCAHQLDPDRADDATQATFVRALTSLPRFRHESSARTWLFGVARNTCLDEMRSRGRRQRLRARLQAQPPPDSATGADVSDLDLRRALATLDPDRRDAFVLTQIVGLGYADAAQVLDVPIGTIRSRVSRARSDLVVDGRALTVPDVERPA